MSKTAELLIKLRKSKGWTQNELATKLGVSSQAVSKWERAENLPDSMLLLDISKLYGTTVDNLLSGTMPAEAKEEKVKNDFMVMVGAFILMLSALPMILFFNINLAVAILTTSVMASIGILILLYVGLKKERNK